ncbi:MAG: hypothetical protein KGZ71_09255 [Desulfobulbaceae bacterium]|nr:hypothetical protein [Desulfobulbaceae bacterium]
MNYGGYRIRIPVKELSNGVYFYEMVSGPFKDIKKIDYSKKNLLQILIKNCPEKLNYFIGHF